MGESVVDLIMTDHRELERLFDELQQTPEKRTNLVPVMTALLTAHERAEEDEVYPAARAEGISEDVEHSQREHLEADQLAEKVVGGDPASEVSEAELNKLIAAIKHHIEEEESTLLPKMRSEMAATRLEELGEAFLTSRAAHLGEQPGERSKVQMRQQAANVGLTGSSSMGKSELERSLDNAAES